MRRTLAGRRPGDAVLGEEEGLVGDGPRRWVVDPIDGTKNFVRGVPVWATLVALQVEGSVDVGRGQRACARPPLVGGPRGRRVRGPVAGGRAARCG